MPPKPYLNMPLKLDRYSDHIAICPFMLNFLHRDQLLAGLTCRFSLAPWRRVQYESDFNCGYLFGGFCKEKPKGNTVFWVGPLLKAHVVWLPGVCLVALSVLQRGGLMSGFQIRWVLPRGFEGTKLIAGSKHCGRDSARCLLKESHSLAPWCHLLFASCAFLERFPVVHGHLGVWKLKAFPFPTDQKDTTMLKVQMDRTPAPRRDVCSAAAEVVLHSAMLAAWRRLWGLG